MSSLMKKVELHVEQEYPAEFDENWVNQLLTEKTNVESNSSNQSQKINHEKELLKDIARVDAELRKQKLIRKLKQVSAPKKVTPSKDLVRASKKVKPSAEQVRVPKKVKPLVKQAKKRSLSAIEKQKIAHEIKSKARNIKTEVPAPVKPKKNLLSRLKNR